MKVLSNGATALFEVHLRHIVCVYPGMNEFEALIVHGEAVFVTVILVGSSAKTPDPQVSSYEHVRMHPAIEVGVKKFVYE